MEFYESVCFMKRNFVKWPVLWKGILCRDTIEAWILLASITEEYFLTSLSYTIKHQTSLSNFNHFWSLYRFLQNIFLLKIKYLFFITLCGCHFLILIRSRIIALLANKILFTVLTFHHDIAKINPPTTCYNF